MPQPDLYNIIPLVTPSALQIMSQINGGSSLAAKSAPLSALPAAVAVPQPPMVVRPQPAPAAACVHRPAPPPAPGVLGFDYRRIRVPAELQQSHERMARLAGRLGDASRLKLRRPAQAS